MSIKLERERHGALLDYAGVLLDVINELPNVDEIKATPEYTKAYDAFRKAEDAQAHDYLAELKEKVKQQKE